MVKFLEYDLLKKEIFYFFEIVEEEFVIVFLYIKLDKKLKVIFERKMYDESFVLWILCGKNEDDVSKSFCFEDFEFFKKFKNVSIYYYLDLYVKYYVNDVKSIVILFNLYEFLIKNNIEIGVLFKRNYRGVDNKNDDSVYEYFYEVFEDSIEIFVKIICLEKCFFGLIKIGLFIYIEVDKFVNIYKKVFDEFRI